MKPLFVAAILAAFLLAGCQTAETVKAPAEQSCPPGSVPGANLAAYLNQTNMKASFNLPEAHAAAVVEKINAMPPTTEWAPDKVTVYYNQSHALLVFHMGDCVASPGPVPGGVLDRFLRSIQPLSS